MRDLDYGLNEFLAICCMGVVACVTMVLASSVFVQHFALSGHLSVIPVMWCMLTLPLLLTGLLAGKHSLCTMATVGAVIYVFGLACPLRCEPNDLSVYTDGVVISICPSILFAWVLIEFRHLIVSKMKRSASTSWRQTGRHCDREVDAPFYSCGLGEKELVMDTQQQKVKQRFVANQL
ncbi:MAG TPA: hypothetical protein PLP17_11275 [Oligoflexia bacterium]|nr:hypothetical protein [Oligoflexia bacterium]